MKSIKSLTRPLLFLTVIGIVLIPLITYAFRYALWQSKLRCFKLIAAYCIAYSGSLNGLDKETVVKKMGRPARESDRYALLPLRASTWATGINADLLLLLDQDNRIKELCYAWKDFVPVESNEFNSQTWKGSSPDVKIRMTADLIRRWREGNFGDAFCTLEQAERVLGETLFVDEWWYRIEDWTALVVSFDAQGKVTHAQIRCDD